jgi:signal transduction histidine kinase/ActR/RegA family two-component response regulator
MVHIDFCMLPHVYMIPNTLTPSIPGFPSDSRLVFFATVVLYFLAGKIGQYLIFNLHSSPAIIQATFGIAIAAVIVYGWRALLPIALAQFLLSLSHSESILTTLIFTTAYTAQAALAYYLLQKFKFQTSPPFEKTQDTLTFTAVTLFCTAIGPFISTSVQALTHTLSLTLFDSIARTWAGGIFSVLIVTPLILLWPPLERSWAHSKRQVLELFAAFTLLTLTCVVIFATKDAQPFGIAIIFFIPAVLLWFLLRFHPRWLALASFITAVIGVVGTIVSNPSTIPINDELLSVEIYLGIFAAIFLVFTTLVEENKRTNKELHLQVGKMEKVVAKLNAQEKARTEFISVLAHELRNPLAPVVSSLEWLNLQNLSEEAKTVVTNAHEQALMMESLLDDLLDTARVSQNKFRLHKEQVTLQTCIARSVAATSDFYKKRRHTLTMSVPADPIQLLADPVRIQQMIINVLNNAGKYTESGGSISLTCSEENGLAVIKVKDNGIGISPKDIETLFEPFHRVRLHPRFGTGLGIGLALTRKLAQMHGGTITAESEGVDRGSTFTISLPVVALPQARTISPTQTSEQKTGALRVLIVDDNDSAARGLSKLLTHHGHTVQTAHNGEKALESVQPFNPDVVLLDIGLPDIDGYEVARRLRARGWRGPLVALTGYGLDQDKTDAKDAGFDQHLVKPVGISDVLTTINTLAQPAAA